MSRASAHSDLPLLDDLALAIDGVASEFRALNPDLAAGLSRLSRLASIARFARMAPPYDSDDPTWSEILGALPQGMRRALLDRLLAAPQLRSPLPAVTAHMRKQREDAERDEIICACRCFALPEKSDREAAKILAAFLNKQASRRTPPVGWIRQAIGKGVLSDERIRQIWRKNGVGGEKRGLAVDLTHIPRDNISCEQTREAHAQKTRKPLYYGVKRHCNPRRP